MDHSVRPIDEYFNRQDEPIKSCLDFLRGYILKFNPNLTEAWKYGMPFFCINGKMCCYLWMHKKYKLPYIGVVEGKRLNHPDLLQEDRARMKILLVDPTKDLPLDVINEVLNMMLALY